MATESGMSRVTTRAGWPQGMTLAIAGFLPVLSILSLAPTVPSILRHFATVPFAETLVPLMVTAPGLMVALLAPFVGILVDRHGRRRLILLATFLYGFAGIAPLFLDNLPAMFATRLVVGATEAIILVIVNALFADYFDLRNRRTWITVQGISGPILGTASIATAGALTAWRWNGAFLIYGVALVVFLVMVAVLFEPMRHRPIVSETIAAPRRPFPSRTVAAYCGVTLFASVLYYVFIVQSGLAFDAIGVTASANLGLLISFCTLGTPVGALLFNLLSRRVAGETLIATFLLFMGIGMLGMGLARSAEVMAAFGFVQQIGGGITVTALIFWVSRLLPPEHRGFGFGAWTSAFFAGQFVSPVIVGGVRYVSGGILSAFAVMGIAALLGSALILVVRRSLPQPLDSQ